MELNFWGLTQALCALFHFISVCVCAPAHVNTYKLTLGILVDGSPLYVSRSYGSPSVPVQASLVSQHEVDSLV